MGISLCCATNFAIVEDYLRASCQRRKGNGDNSDKGRQFRQRAPKQSVNLGSACRPSLKFSAKMTSGEASPTI